jgi:hypothetical protein
VLTEARQVCRTFEQRRARLTPSRVGCCPVLSPAVILCTEKFESPVYLFVHATLSYDLLIL